MALIGGVDPGVFGAVAVLDTETSVLTGVWDMPTYLRVVNRTERRRLDLAALDALLDTVDMLGVSVLWIEDVGGRGGQKGGGAFSFGVGVIHGICVARRIRVETVNPTAWKAKMRAPAGKEGATQRAEQIFPQQRGLFRGPQGGRMDGRAEAAMIALYGGLRA